MWLRFILRVWKPEETDEEEAAQPEVIEKGKKADDEEGKEEGKAEKKEKDS